MSHSNTEIQERTEKKNVVKGMVQPVLRYLDDRYGPEVTDRILTDIDLDRLFFDDPNGFMPIETTDILFESAKKYTGDNDFPYTMGRNVLKYMNPLQAIMTTTFASPSLIFNNLERVEQKVVKTTRVKTTRLGPHKFHIRISFADNYREPFSACRNRQGSYEAVPTIFKLPYAKVEHPKCAFRGDSNCEYIVTIPQTWFQWFFKASVATLGAGIISGIGYLLNGTSVLALLAASSPVFSMLFYVIYTRRRFAEGIKWLKNAEHSIETQSEELKQDSKRTKYLHDLTVKLNREVHCEPISSHVTKVLVDNFTYDSSQIWLKEGDRFFCSGVAGYEGKVREEILSTEYSVTEGLKHPDGFIVRVLKNKETLLINDLKKVTAGFTMQSKQLFSSMKISSAIIIPLSDHQKVFGMLVGINKNGKKVSYTDKILFETMTHIVSNSLHKALLYESMEEKIRKRDREIKRRQEQVIFTREMTIQNEKLSAIGQMAAGIAHEINNPLNFLFNIVPELRGDFLTLKKVATVAQNNLDNTTKQNFEHLMEEYQLDTHLDEVDEVFNYVDKALSKARKTANSLKVFARTSGNDSDTLLNLKSVINDAIELIPAKYLSTVNVVVEVPDEIELRINRVEFQQILLNLLNNAIEACNNNKNIRVEAQRSAGKIVVSVRDWGKGISFEHEKSIFRPFFTTKDTHLHTGLGLTVAKELIKKYGGEIVFESGNKSGTVFTIIMPGADDRGL
ncbi:ATP-binding protein [Chitinispirillales bacterium ANBcel5]|uniref:ATP-binding protein n=1 Tax=Cellulosispirillum alkaliphilum TaxID=3039283 RepID=UPI002A522725|nr:ATP-binding protein [Chitinispirillales bacterium ANBcel5]